MTTLTPPSPAPGAPDATKRASGLGIASLVLGLVALLLGLIPFVGFGTWILGLVGVVLGIVGLVQKQRRRGLPLAGLIVSAVAIVVGLAISIAAVIGVAGAVTQSLGDITAGPVAAGSSTAPTADSGTDASASWYTETYGSFTTKTVTGTGDDVIRLPKDAKGGLVVATYSGSGNFSITPQDADNASTGELLVNTIGRYKGTTAWGLSSLGDATTLKVSASGKWKVVLKAMDSAKALSPKGSGDGVYKYTGGATAWTVSHKGQSNFVVAEYSSSLIPNLAVNEIGRYRGRVPADAGPAIVVVNADGKWTIK